MEIEYGILYFIGNREDKSELLTIRIKKIKRKWGTRNGFHDI